GDTAHDGVGQVTMKSVGPCLALRHCSSQPFTACRDEPSRQLTMGSMAPARRNAVSRPHTGRRRNEAARHAVLVAAIELLGGPDGQDTTVEAIARAAGVGKQT